MSAQMIIESLMYFGAGFLLAALCVLIIVPLVHGRAARLTTRQLEASIPLTMAEVQADKDLQRAEFAISTRRLERNIEQLRTKSAGQLAELGRKGDAINCLKVEVSTLRERLRVTEERVAEKMSATRDAQRQLSEKETELTKLMTGLAERSSIADAQNAKIIALKSQLEEVEAQLFIAGNANSVGGSVDVARTVSVSSSRNDRRSKRNAMPLAPTNWPNAELEKVPMDFSQSRLADYRGHKDDAAAAVPEDWRIAKLGNRPVDSAQNLPPNGRSHEGVRIVPAVPMDSSHSFPTTDLPYKGDVIPALQISPKTEEVQTSGVPAPDRDARDHASEQRIKTARKEPDIFAGLRAADRSTHVFPRLSSFKGDITRAARENWRIAKSGNGPIDSGQSPPPNGRHHEGVSFGDVVVPEVRQSAEEAQPSGGTACAPNAGGGASKQHVGNITRAARENWRIAKSGNGPIDSGQIPPPNGRPHEGVSFGDVVVPEVWQSAEEAQPSVGTASAPNAGGGASKQYIRTARKGSGFSAEPCAADLSVHLFPPLTNDKFGSDTSSNGRRTSRTVAHFIIAALIIFGWLSAGQPYREEMEKIASWILPVGQLSPSSMTKSSPAPTPAAAATSSELAQQLEAMPRDLASMRHTVAQLAERQKQLARKIAALRASKHRISPHLKHRATLAPWPDTRPTTIPGWTLRGITNGEAILEGPSGVWRAMRGDTVPGVGRVETMVRWGNRLIVATSSGLISTP